MSDEDTKPLDERAREHAARAIDTLSAIMNDDMAEDRDRIRAAEAILDRGYGKAAQAIIQVPASKKQQEILAALSDQQLVAIIEKKQLPRIGPAQPLVTVTADSTGASPVTVTADSTGASPVTVDSAVASAKMRVQKTRTQQNMSHGPAVDIYGTSIDPLLI